MHDTLSASPLRTRGPFARGPCHFQVAGRLSTRRDPGSDGHAGLAQDQVSSSHAPRAPGESDTGPLSGAVTGIRTTIGVAGARGGLNVEARPVGAGVEAGDLSSGGRDC